jgi:hypothetical protein
VAGKADLTTEETEHLVECDDCRIEVMGLQRVVEGLPDIDKARRFLAEEGTLPLAAQAPKEIHEEQRELNETEGA